MMKNVQINHDWLLKMITDPYVVLLYWFLNTYYVNKSIQYIGWFMLSLYLTKDFWIANIIHWHGEKDLSHSHFLRMQVNHCNICSHGTQKYLAIMSLWCLDVPCVGVMPIDVPCLGMMARCAVCWSYAYRCVVCRYDGLMCRVLVWCL